jgi:hypothetical protein
MPDIILMIVSTTDSRSHNTLTKYIKRTPDYLILCVAVFLLVTIRATSVDLIYLSLLLNENPRIVTAQI